MRWMRNPLHDVSLFHWKFKQTYNGAPPAEVREFRKRLIREEAEELCEAIDLRNPVKIAREAIDLIYVSLGTLVLFELPFAKVWSAVHRANMDKRYRGPGVKPGKPENWQDPDEEIAYILTRRRKKKSWRT